MTYQDVDGKTVKKQLYPNEARLRNLSYESNIYVDIHHKLETVDPKTMESEITEYFIDLIMVYFKYTNMP